MTKQERIQLILTAIKNVRAKIILAQRLRANHKAEKLMEDLQALKLCLEYELDQEAA